LLAAHPKMLSAAFVSTPALSGILPTSTVTAARTKLLMTSKDTPATPKNDDVPDDYEYPYDDFAKSKVLNENPDDFASYMAKRKAAEDAAKGK
jgi:hypothetical protein